MNWIKRKIKDIKINLILSGRSCCDLIAVVVASALVIVGMVFVVL